MPSGSTHWDHVHAIANGALRPFQVKFVSERLKEDRSIRGRVYFGHAGDQIQQILMNYPTLRWWMEAGGLVIDEPAAEMGPLDLFDSSAGELVISKWTEKGLPLAELVEIAKQLDAKGFELKACLQPAQWKPISDHNQKFARKAIRTFEAAAQDKRFVRGIRKRLYLSRDRYRKAQRPVQPILFEF
jgi:hypothetical protein